MNTSGFAWGTRFPPPVLDFSIRGRPHPPQNSLFLDVWVQQVHCTLLRADLKERNASLAPPFLPASADRRGRDFTQAIHLSDVGEGTQEQERPSSRGWERREAEKMETGRETKMRQGTQKDCFSACECVQGGTAFQAPRGFLLPPATSPRDMPDLLRHSWIPEQIV